MECMAPIGKNLLLQWANSSYKNAIPNELNEMEETVNASPAQSSPLHLILFLFMFQSTQTKSGCAK